MRIEKPYRFDFGDAVTWLTDAGRRRTGEVRGMYRNSADAEIYQVSTGLGRPGRAAPTFEVHGKDLKEANNSE